MNIRRLLGRMKARVLAGPQPVILMYHRIAEPEFDPWGLSVSPARFAEQVGWLRRHRLPMSMDEFVSRLAGRKLPSHAVALTFDDGYRDNLTSAKPVLDSAGVPATVFLATGHLGSGRPFWWDELVAFVLARRQAADAEVKIGPETIRLVFPEATTAAELSPGWRAWEEPATARQKLYLDVWSRLQRLDDSIREAVMDALRERLGPVPVPADSLPMQPSEIPVLALGGNVGIGAHTRIHPPLAMLDSESQQAEIAGSRADCRGLLQRDVSGFAYPYGNLGPGTAELVREAGFRWACTTESHAVDRKKYGLFNLPRIQVMDWPAEQFRLALSRAAT